MYVNTCRRRGCHITQPNMETLGKMVHVTITINLSVIGLHSGGKHPLHQPFYLVHLPCLAEFVKKKKQVIESDTTI